MARKPGPVPSDRSVVFEGESVSLEVYVSNAPEGGVVETVTVHLTPGSWTWKGASESDYSFPSTVTIPRGENRATFVVRAHEDNLEEPDEKLNIYASQIDYLGESYEQADLSRWDYSGGIDLTIADTGVYDFAPIVTTRVFSPAFDAVNEGYTRGLAVAVTNMPLGAAHDLTVHLAARHITTSDYDFSYQSIVTIPRGRTSVSIDIRAFNDDLVEGLEYFEIYVTSVDYRGRNYEQSNMGARLRIRDHDRIQDSLTVLGGVDHVKGTTMTVRLELNHPLPESTPLNVVKLAFALNGSTRAVDADGGRTAVCPGTGQSGGLPGYTNESPPGLYHSGYTVLPGG